MVIGHDRYGDAVGPTVVLLHPSGFGPSLLRPFARRLAERHDVVLPHRRGYADSIDLPPPDSLDDLHDDLAELLDDLDVASPLLVGASAGATLTVGFLQRHPGRARGGIAHEPLIGPLGGGLHTVVSDRIVTLLERADQPCETSLFMTGLIGLPAWNALREDYRVNVERHAVITRTEAALFKGFALDDDELRGLAPVLVSTVGEQSPPLRWDLAAVLDDHGIPTRVLPGTAHLPMLEAPDALMATIDDVAGPRVDRADGADPVHGATA